ncbi:hypothetical protein KHP62_08425 [Rhodobacteraceae bacterium NNCM2]|nr:hypothetical protein [Coraliihabitans acroporae]
MRTVIFALISAVSLAVPARAGIVINPQGIFLTEPEVPAFVVDESGQAYFGGPATGYRQFGRSGYSPIPYDPGLYRYGKGAYDGAGFAFEPMLHGKVQMQLTDETFFGLIDRETE